jgi:hypothetical protein
MAHHTFDLLRQIIANVTCKPGWEFALASTRSKLDCDRVLEIRVTGSNARIQDEDITIRHNFPVPIATYNEMTWRRWIFDCCIKVETHELGEFFMIAGERPFAPLHGPGEDPYVIHEFRPEVDARTRQDGTISD